MGERRGEGGFSDSARDATAVLPTPSPIPMGEGRGEGGFCFARLLFQPWHSERYADLTVRSTAFFSAKICKIPKLTPLWILESRRNFARSKVNRERRRGVVR
jgi:hypothetical protein